MKYIIGVVGENGAGKDTFTTFFRATAAPLAVSRVRFSDVLYDTLKLWRIESSRTNLQNLAIIIDQQFGKGSVTSATEDRIKRQKGDIVVVEGIRWKQDVPMLRAFPNSVIVYITAKPEIRFERMKKRGDKTGESKITHEQFGREEKALTELEIPKIGKSADFKIDNDGSLDEFRQKVENLFTQLKM